MIPIPINFSKVDEGIHKAFDQTKAATITAIRAFEENVNSTARLIGELCPFVNISAMTADEMDDRNERIRAQLHLSATEWIVRDYKCNWTAPNSESVEGRLYLLPSGFGFKETVICPMSKDGRRMFFVSYSEVRELRKSKSLLAPSLAITLKQQVSDTFL